MAYLSADEYNCMAGGYDSGQLVNAASDLIDGHCRRSGFGIAQYMERFRVGRQGS